MYTIGTSALRYIEANISDTNIAGALIDKLMVYVGTQDEIGKEVLPVPVGHVAHPATVISPVSAFFVVPAVSAARPYEFANPILYVDVLIPNDPYNPTAWTNVGQITGNDLVLLLTIIKPAGGYINALYAMPHGLLADRVKVPRVAGLTYYATDTRELYVFDSVLQDWLQVYSAALAQNIVGLMVIWPEALDATTPIPGHYIRANGSEVPKATYAQLYSVIGDVFGTPVNPSNFILPSMNNTIIRYEV